MGGDSDDEDCDCDATDGTVFTFNNRTGRFEPECPLPRRCPRTKIIKLPPTGCCRPCPPPAPTTIYMPLPIPYPVYIHQPPRPRSPCRPPPNCCPCPMMPCCGFPMTQCCPGGFPGGFPMGNCYPGPFPCPGPCPYAVPMTPCPYPDPWNPYGGGYANCGYPAPCDGGDPQCGRDPPCTPDDGAAQCHDETVGQQNDGAAGSRSKVDLCREPCQQPQCPPGGVSSSNTGPLTQDQPNDVNTLHIRSQATVKGP